MTIPIENVGDEWRTVYSLADGAAYLRRSIDAAEAVSTGLYSYDRPESKVEKKLEKQRRAETEGAAGKETPDGPDSGRRVRNRRSRQL